MKEGLKFVLIFLFNFFALAFLFAIDELIVVVNAIQALDVEAKNDFINSVSKYKLCITAAIATYQAYLFNK